MINKLESTKKCVLLLLGACGEQDMQDVITEVRVQAYLSHLQRAMTELMREGKIAIEHEDDETIVYPVY
jgi:hypothetical protein